MTPVSQFAQYLLKLDPQRNQSRLTLFNFLKHVLDPNTPLSPLTLQSFYSRVLQFEHWQNDAQSLAETIRADLTGYLKQYVQERDLPPWLELRHPDTLQLVQLKLFNDMEELVMNEYAARQKSGDQIKTVKMNDSQILVLILSRGGNLEAKVYPMQAVVWGARLKLATPVTHLFYSSDLELMPHVRQTLEGSLLTTHCFHMDHEGAHGLITRGYTFQKFETFIRAKLSETQDLFSSLKKVERHFIEPSSDPFYQEMVSRLERANRLMQSSSPDSLSEAERALNRGRLALKNLFPNDRLLTLLVTHLDYGINQRRSSHPPQQIPR
jgi:hypothetical protein